MVAKRRTRKRPAHKPTRRTRRPAAKPYKLGATRIDNRELQDIIDGLGMRLVPKDELTPLQELENRIDRMCSRVEESIDAGRKASEDFRKHCELIARWIDEIRKDVSQHSNRLHLLEAGQVEQDRRIDQHTQLLTALQERTKGI